MFRFLMMYILKPTFLSKIADESFLYILDTSIDFFYNLLSIYSIDE